MVTSDILSWNVDNISGNAKIGSSSVSNSYVNTDTDAVDLGCMDNTSRLIEVVIRCTGSSLQRKRLLSQES